MDSNHSGMARARQSGRLTATRRALCALSALIGVIVLLATGPVVADDGEALERSVMAPLAERSLMLDVAAVDGRLVAVGERGHVLVSTDGGRSWRQVEAPTRSLLTAIAFAGPEVGVAVGHDSVILRTTDGGETWERVHWAPEDEAPLFDVWFADELNGVAIGAYGSRFRTFDGGATWEFEPIGEDDWHLQHIALADTGALYMAAEAGMLYRSDDGGESWSELPSPYEGSFFGLLPLEGDTLLAFGLRGHLFRSEDGGTTWAEIDTGTVAILNAGVRLADGTIVIVGLGGTVLTSTDGGHSFGLFQRPARRGISSVIEVGDGELLLVGEFGLHRATVAELSANHR
ncbi:MAG: YCF48-related protein [Thermoanaerobaculales bacterium]|jgi:photosystem II stability/assembly factor-like uncharacterized protein|nr:YCF48-related protein [Thermoanaerobaculales bacterium]